MFLYADLARLADGVASAIEADSAREAEAALADLAALLVDQGEAVQEGERLAITVLEERRSDPLSAYLVEAGRIRIDAGVTVSDLGGRLQEYLASADFEEGERIIEDIITALELERQRWQRLESPAEARQVHAQQVRLIDNAIEAERQLMQMLHDEDLSSLPAFLQTVVRDQGTQGAQLSADWNDLLIEALSR